MSMTLSKIMKMQIKKNFITGFLVFVPIAVTFWIIAWIVGRMNNVLAIQDGRFFYVIPESLHPNHLLGFRIPLLGVVITIAGIYLIGLFTRNVLGGRVLQLADRLLEKIPFARVIYRGTKQLLMAITLQRSELFRHVVMVEFPRPGMWSIAFVTGAPAKAILKEVTSGKEYVNLFIPCTPNPTTGYYAVVAKDEIREVSLTVDEAFKILVSAGMFQPDHQQLTWEEFAKS